MKRIVVYGKEGCNPCATMKKMLEEAGTEYEYKDIMKNMDDVSKYDLRNVPTTLVFEGEEVMKKIVGISKEVLL